MSTAEIRHFHLFCGLGGGAKGFNQAQPRVGNMVARFRCIGGIDVDAASIRDFGRLAGVPGTVQDLFDRDQYRDFHGAEPPADWREAGTADIHRAAGGERPHIVFLSAPCKGFSGLLSEGKSKTDKYQALNRLTLRGVWLMLEAWRDDPPELVIFENVPRIATRGRHLLDQIVDLLRAYGYAVAETTHDCGELGGLAQSRKRFLLVGRHIEKVPPFLYEPHSRPLRAVGDVLGRMLMPGDLRGGPMHRIPALQWKTWVRLAFVEAGSDWRSLNRLAVEDGKLRDYLIVPENRNSGFLGVGRWDSPRGTVTGRSLPNNGDFAIADPRQQLYAAGYGVTPWDAASGAVAGESLPSNGKFAVQDPRFAQSAKWKDGQALGVRAWGQSTGTVAGQQGPGQGAYSVADPRHAGPAKHSNEFRIVRWDKSSMAVTSAHGTGQAVADPRGGADPALLHGKYPITGWDETARTVIGGNANGAFAVADPRSGMQRGKGDSYLTAGHYGVVPWTSPSGAVSAAAGHDNGRWNVADPRMPAASDKLVCRITAEDGTWHRPFTTLELAALQSLVDPEEMLELDGLSDQAWRERIGNAVPAAAATAIAEVMGTTLLLAWSGETFLLSSQPIWVRQVAVALAVQGVET
ncbi:MAG: DNA cytosine methyltransferase [Diaphorobacter nitroreducens]|uniref:DNA cytosine methyltransferase n=1 Tax=Diaphorobacter nitroreducens TaxID=164759 RepID=UPI003C77A62E